MEKEGRKGEKGKGVAAGPRGGAAAQSPPRPLPAPPVRPNKARLSTVLLINFSFSTKGLSLYQYLNLLGKRKV